MSRLPILRPKRVATACGLMAALLLLAAACTAVAWFAQGWLMGKGTMVAQSASGGDYFMEADWGIRRLAAGHIFQLFASPGGLRAAPLMMPFSLLIRGAVDAAASGLGLITLHSGVRIVHANGNVTPFFHPYDWYRYLAGTLGIVFVGAALMLGSAGLRPGCRKGALIIVGVLALLLTPLTGDAIFYGHPEEALEGFLVFSGLLAAHSGRWRYSAVMFGLAIATKQPCWLLVPALPFLYPRERVWQLLGLTAAVAAVVIAPFILPHMSVVTGAQTTQIGATAGTSTTSMFQSVWGAFFYSHIGNFTALGRPLTLLLAVLVPVLAAWRSGWRLTVVQGAAVMALVLLLRAALDPFNINYYAAPACAAMIALEMVVWGGGGHPFARGRWLRRLWPLPILSIAGIVLVAGALGGFIQHWVGTLRVSELVLALSYLFINAVLASVLIVVASGVRMQLTATRLRVYGSVTAAVAACVVAMSIADHAGSTRDQVPPPPGYAAITPQRLATLGLAVYWLGDSRLPQNMYLRVSALGDKAAAAYTFFDYGASAETVHTISVFNIVAKPTSGALAELRFCKTHTAKCVKKKLRIITTPLGPGLLKTTSASAWDLYVLRGRDIVYVTSTLDISPEKAASLLQPLRGSHQQASALSNHAATLIGGGS